MFEPETCASLQEVINHLEKLDPNLVVPLGLGQPHSYRGYYDQVAFEPATDITVREMLVHAKGAVGTAFCGYKGGSYTMGPATPCWLAPWGQTGKPIVCFAKAVHVLPPEPGDNYL